jgi:hypothetical protein
MGSKQARRMTGTVKQTEMFTVSNIGKTRVQMAPALLGCSWNQKATGRKSTAAMSHVTAVRIVASRGVSRERYGGTTMHR